MLCASHLHLTLLCLAFNIVWLWLLLYLVMGSFPLQGLGLWRIETKKIDLRKTVLCWNSETLQFSLSGIELVNKNTTEKYLYSAHFYCCFTYSSIFKLFHIFSSFFRFSMFRWKKPIHIFPVSFVSGGRNLFPPASHHSFLAVMNM